MPVLAVEIDLQLSFLQVDVVDQLGGRDLDPAGRHAGKVLGLRVRMQPEDVGRAVVLHQVVRQAALEVLRGHAVERREELDRADVVLELVDVPRPVRARERVGNAVSRRARAAPDDIVARDDRVARPAERRGRVELELALVLDIGAAERRRLAGDVGGDRVAAHLEAARLAVDRERDRHPELVDVGDVGDVRRVALQVELDQVVAEIVGLGVAGREEAHGVDAGRAGDVGDAAAGGSLFLDDDVDLAVGDPVQRQRRRGADGAAVDEHRGGLNEDAAVVGEGIDVRPVAAATEIPAQNRAEIEADY